MINFNFKVDNKSTPSQSQIQLSLVIDKDAFSDHARALKKHTSRLADNAKSGLDGLIRRFKNQKPASTVDMTTVDMTKDMQGNWGKRGPRGLAA